LPPPIGRLGRWRVTKFAIVIAAITSGLHLASAAGLRDRALIAPLPLAIAGEFGVALLVGVTADLFRPFIRNRWQAAAVGALAWLPAMILILFLVGRGEISWLEAAKVAVVGALFIGGIGGAFLFSPPQEPL